jgi:hypothetical protein
MSKNSFFKLRIFARFSTFAESGFPGGGQYTCGYRKKRLKLRHSLYEILQFHIFYKPCGRKNFRYLYASPPLMQYW